MPKSAMNLTADRLRELARTGAEVTVRRRAEIIAIERTYLQGIAHRHMKPEEVFPTGIMTKVAI
jgi:hypothetical protein